MELVLWYISFSSTILFPSMRRIHFIFQCLPKFTSHWLKSGNAWGNGLWVIQWAAWSYMPLIHFKVKSRYLTNFTGIFVTRSMLRWLFTCLLTPSGYYMYHQVLTPQTHYFSNAFFLQYKVTVRLAVPSDWHWLCKFDVHGSMHRKRVFKYNKQDATLHNLLISVKCATCFRRFLHPSSGAQNLYIASGTSSNLYCYLALSWKRWRSISSTTEAGRRKGLTKVPDAIYSFWAPDDGWRNGLKHVERFTEINNLGNVASCWFYLEILTV